VTPEATVRPPAGPSAPARRAWRDAVVALELLDRDPAEHYAHLRVFVDAETRRVELEARWRADGAPMRSSGSAGQAVTHPDVVELRSLEQHVAQLADKLFGVAPRLGGWQRGNARSPDRQYRPRRRATVVKLPDRLREALGE